MALSRSSSNPSALTSPAPYKQQKKSRIDWVLFTTHVHIVIIIYFLWRQCTRLKKYSNRKWERKFKKQEHCGIHARNLQESRSDIQLGLAARVMRMQLTCEFSTSGQWKRSAQGRAKICQIRASFWFNIQYSHNINRNTYPTLLHH